MQWFTASQMGPLFAINVTVGRMFAQLAGILLVVGLSFTASAQSRASFLDEWLGWEQQANTPKFRRKSSNVAVSLVRVPKSAVAIDAVNRRGAKLAKRFLDPKNPKFFLLPIHPGNTSPQVGFSQFPEAAQVAMETTASRTMVFGEEDPISVKAGTDHPFGDDPGSGPAAPKKVFLQGELQVGLAHSAHIAAIDRMMGADLSFHVLPEVASLTDRSDGPGKGNGIILRDMRGLRRGHRYLPAFAIPYVGAEIARKNGSDDMAAFWQKHDAEAYGKVKARFIARYGLTFTTPNAQNRLIELDKNYRPTGRIILRDLPDTHFVAGLVAPFGISEIADKDLLPAEDSFAPKGSNSFWQMNLAMDPEVVTDWTRAHVKAYYGELRRMAGTSVQSPDFAQGLQTWRETNILANQSFVGWLTNRSGHYGKRSRLRGGTGPARRINSVHRSFPRSTSTPRGAR